MSDEFRIHVLEERMDNLGDTVNRVDVKLDGIAATLSSLARIEERQMHTNEKLASSASQGADHESRIRVLEKAMPDNLEPRLTKMENDMPGLLENRGWVISGVLGVICLVGIAVLKLVILGA